MTAVGLSDEYGRPAGGAGAGVNNYRPLFSAGLKSAMGMARA